MKNEVANKLNAELAKANQAAADAWHAFDSARTEAKKELGAEGLAKSPDALQKLDELSTAASAAKQSALDIREQLDGVLRWESGDGGSGEPQPPDPQPPANRSASQRFTDSDSYKRLVESGVLDRTKSRVNMEPVPVMSRDETTRMLTGQMLAADPITGGGAASGGAFVTPQRLGGFYELLYGPNTVLGLITNGQTDSDMVEYVRQLTFANAAAPVAEATYSGAVADADVSGGDITGVKPQSAMTFEVVQETVKAIAHWIAVTKRALADVAGMRTIIDSQLEAGLRRVLEEQVVSGSGSGLNLRGILNQPNINTPAAGANDLESIMKGITAIRMDFMEPNAVGLHPQDWEDIRLRRDDSGAAAGTGGYFYGPPSIAGPQTVWGLQAIVSQSFPQGTAVVGKFDEYILWTREGVTTTATDSHDDFFVRNLIAVLTEGRWAAGLPRPQAFAEVDVSAS